MNNKLTDERPDDESLEFLITIRREIAERHASEGRMEQCAVHTLILNALLELQKLRKADSEPAGYHVIKECGKVGCSVATLKEAEKTRDFWNKKWTIRPYFYSAAPAPVVPDEISPKQASRSYGGEVHGYRDGWNACRAAMLQAGNSPVTPDGWKLAPEKADEDMIAEGNIMASCMIETVGKIDVSLIYGAMLAAAPQQEVNHG
ncbi:hypothetical protein EZ440_20720 [Salmonella enterica]|nr:hypothetical protein [Salmonella enterica]